MNAATEREAAWTRFVLPLCIGLAFVAYAWLALARYRTFHNETYDLAMYARIAWGATHGDVWEPIVNAYVFGVHWAWVLLIPGAVAQIADPAETLLVFQSAAMALAAWPLARVGRHVFGPWGVLIAVLYLVHPNTLCVATYEAHPGNFALLPLGFACCAILERRAWLVTSMLLLALLCREDLALLTAPLCLLAASERVLPKWAAFAQAALHTAYFFAFVHYQPSLITEVASTSLHFGHLGGSPSAMVETALSDPGKIFAHISARPRLLYLPTVLATLAFLPLAAPRWLLCCGAVFAMNLLSQWPGTVDLDSHYLTPALPLLFVAACVGAKRLMKGRASETAGSADDTDEKPPSGSAPKAVVVGALGLCGAAAASIGLMAFDPADYTEDARTLAAREILDLIPEGEPFQGPDELLAHLADTVKIHRSPPPERRTKWVVLSAPHRLRYLHDETLLRTEEEPLIREWLMMVDHTLVHAAGPYLLMERHRHPREGAGGSAIIGRADPNEGAIITDCLRLRGAKRSPDGQVLLDLVGVGDCPPDLALRIDTTNPPKRTDLLFSGWLSPIFIERGDHLISPHRFEGQPELIYVSAVRTSGARPKPSDPRAVPVRVTPFR